MRVATLFTIATAVAVSFVVAIVDDTQQRVFNPSHSKFQYLSSRWALQNELGSSVVRFDGDHLLRITLSHQDDASIIADIESRDDIVVDVWKKTVDFVDVRVPAPFVSTVAKVLVDSGLNFDILSEDIQTMVDHQQSFISVLDGYKKEYLGGPIRSDPFFKAYHSYDAVLEFLDVIAKAYPDRVRMVEVGRSYEGRKIMGLTLSGNNASSVKAAVVYHGGQHAREWIGVAVNCYLIRFLLSPESTLLEDLPLEITIIPIMNPDGYEYSRTKNRMWRKNRQPNGVFPCIGTDTNRNWDSAWNTGGSSGNPCSDAFHGPSAFSAPEPKAIADFILAKQKSVPVVSYIDWHAYSQLWMSPFGSSCTRLPKDHDDLMEAGLEAAKSLKLKYGTDFKVGPVCKIIYQASGGSLDWTYENGVKYSYGVELRDRGRYGFLLPPSEIIPSGEEVAASLSYLHFVVKNERLA